MWYDDVSTSDFSFVESAVAWPQYEIIFFVFNQQLSTVYDSNNGIFRRRQIVRYSSKKAKILLKYFIR